MTMATTPEDYPIQEPEEGDAVRVRFIDTNNSPQQIEGEVTSKHEPNEHVPDDKEWWEIHIDAGYTTYYVQQNPDWDTAYTAKVDGYGPACEIVVIS